MSPDHYYESVYTPDLFKFIQQFRCCSGTDKYIDRQKYFGFTVVGSKSQYSDLAPYISNLLYSFS